MSRAFSRILTLVLLLVSLPLLQGCNRVWATWNEKTISVSTAADPIEVITKTDVAEINVGHRRIVLREDSVSVEGRHQPVLRYRKVVVIEEGGRLKLTLDGKEVL